jgi:signal transduction histidine kinase
MAAAPRDSESGKVELETMEFELESVIQDSVNCIAAQARDKQLDVRLLLPDELKDIKVNGDPFRIRQILINLLSNAVKFTSQGHVSLSVAKLEVRPDACEALVSCRPHWP